MSVVTLLDRVTDWARENICSKIMLKVPPDSEHAATDEGYEYERVHPAAFTMYVPTKEKLPPPVSPFPSLCVRLIEGEDNLAGNSGSVNVQFCFSTWSTGTHSQDEVFPRGDGTYRRGEQGAFSRNGDGWRDAWNFVDAALREVESVTNIEGYALDRLKPIKFGPLTEQESIPDFYPFWFAWMSFSLTYPITRNIREIENFL